MTKDSKYYLANIEAKKSEDGREDGQDYTDDEEGEEEDSLEEMMTDLFREKIRRARKLKKKGQTDYQIHGIEQDKLKQKRSNKNVKLRQQRKSAICAAILQKEHMTSEHRNRQNHPRGSTEQKGSYGEGRGVIKVCKPPSLQKYEDASKRGPTMYKSTINKLKKEGDKDIERGHTKGGKRICDVNLGEYDEELKNNRKADAASKVEAWEKLDNELNKVMKNINMTIYKKGVKIPTLNQEFMDKSGAFAEAFLSADLSFKQLTTRLAFAKEHKDVNEECLDYATARAIVTRKDCSNDIPSPIDTEDIDVYFPVHNRNKEAGFDYQSSDDLFIGDDVNGADVGLPSHTTDEEEKKMDHFREDPYLHLFHSIYHKLFFAQQQSRREWPRLYEQFFFTHAQMMRR